VILLLLTFVSRGLRAQAPPAPAATAFQASQPTFKLQVRKNVVVVRVVVSDPHGRAVVGLREALLAPETAYVLTFSPEKLKENGAFHPLNVRLLNGYGFTVQARKGYFAPGKPTTPEEQAKDQIREAVFSPANIQDFPLEVRAQARKIGPSQVEITVQGRLDVRALSFRREGGRNLNKIILTLALFDTDGKFVSGKQEDLDLALQDTTLANLQKSGIDFRARVLVTPGMYTVRLVARDSHKGAMAALSRVVEYPR
jgi:hypothetical protein